MIILGSPELYDEIREAGSSSNGRGMLSRSRACDSNWWSPSNLAMAQRYVQKTERLMAALIVPRRSVSVA